MVAAETSIVRDGRHHASARARCGVRDACPEKKFWPVPNGVSTSLTVNFGFRKARKRSRGRKARFLESRSRGGGRRDGARGDASVHGHDRVHPFRGPAHRVRWTCRTPRRRARSADAPRRKDIAISPRNVSARRSARAPRREARGSPPPRADAAAKRRRCGRRRSTTTTAESQSCAKSTSSASKARFENVLVALTEGTRRVLQVKRGFRFRFSFFSFFVFPRNPLTRLRRRPSIAQAAGNRASSRRTTATPRRNCPGTRPCSSARRARAPRMATAGSA